jgi:hypothetical protein
VKYSELYETSLIISIVQPLNRSIYGDRKNMTPRKWRWLQELRQQREKDIKTETMNR